MEPVARFDVLVQVPTSAFRYWSVSFYGAGVDHCDVMVVELVVMMEVMVVVMVVVIMMVMVMEVMMIWTFLTWPLLSAKSANK